MTITLAEALRAALLTAGIGGEPDIQANPEQTTVAPVGNSVLELTLEQAQELATNPETDPQTLEALRFRLDAISEAAERNIDTIATATTISALLPELDAAVRNNQGVYPTDTTGSGPIRALQTALNIGEDGVFGEDTAIALTRYLATQIGSEHEIGAAIDLEATPNLQGHLGQRASTDYFHYTQLERLQDRYEERLASLEADVISLGTINGSLSAENQQLSERLNLLIKTELAECTETVIDLENDNPFAGIMQRISDPYTHFDDEIGTANENVAAAIIGECERFFFDIPDTLRETVINDFVERVEGPIAEAIHQAIDETRLNHRADLIRTGTLIQQEEDREVIYRQDRSPFALNAQ